MDNLHSLVSPATHIQEKEKLKHLPSGGRAQKPAQANHEKFRPNATQKQYGNGKIAPSRIRETQHEETTSNKAKDPQVTKVQTING